MAVTLLEIARIFATKVPGKIDADVLQLLWKVSYNNSLLFFCKSLLPIFLFIFLSFIFLIFFIGLIVRIV